MLRLKILLQCKYIYISILFVSICLSLLLNILDKKSIYNDNTKVIYGVITKIQVTNEKIIFILDGKEKVRCTYKGKVNLKLGIKVKLTGKMNKPKGNTIPNTFNYKEYLKHNNIYYVMSVNKIDVLDSNENIFYKIKNKLINYINTFKSSAYLKTFIIGDKSELKDAYDNYQDLGVSHIFAISGMHVSLLTIIMFNILSKTKLKEKYIYISIIVFLLFYLFITDYQASILRSTFMFILLFVNKEADMNIDSLNILMLDISILLFINYNLLFNIGFIYSSVVSFSLIKYSYLINGNYLVKVIKVSLIALLFSIPITIMNNYAINILSLINNIIIVPLISLFIYPLSLITLIIKPLDNIFYFVTNILELITNKLFVFNIIIPKMSFIFYFVYYISIYIFFRTKRYVLFLIPILFILFNYIFILFDNHIYVYYLDVGQGDSTLIKYKNETVMIDTGGVVNSDYKVSDNTIKFLKSIGSTSIDYLILTHGDYDHMGDALNIVNNYKVNNIIFNCGNIDELESNLINNVKYINTYSCINEIKINNYSLKFLNTNLFDNENDNSNVIYLDFNNYKFLFMGDAGVDREREILDKYNLMNIDFIKIGHHGSNTSSSEDFIHSINPKYSLISVGSNNRYGHPKEEVLETLKNSKIYRTDLDGSIEIKLNKNGYKIRTCPP